MTSPPVVLVHGLATTAERTWHQTGWLDLFADAGRRTVAIDLPGHGGAAKPHEAGAFDDLEAEVLSQFPDEPVDAVGFSLGARILLTIAAGSPERFHRLVVAGVGRNLFETDIEHDAMIRRAVTGSPDADDPVAAHFAALADDPDIDQRSLGALLTSSRPALDAEVLAAVTCPVLVVLGEHDFAGPAEPLLDALPDVQFCPLRGVDHFATPKSFDFLAAALEFLDAVPG
ncbi:MAG: alpha/beta fold hydrolase [Acidimicrobiia bacterium]|nr:alpha/beta fold hydrolase [Acidimicrobiia bacterium]